MKNTKVVLSSIFLIALLSLVAFFLYLYQKFFVEFTKSLSSDKNENGVVAFEELADDYVYDADFGKYPGLKAQNQASEEIYSYLNDPERIKDLDANYKYFKVEGYANQTVNSLLISDSSGNSLRTFECSRDRTFAFKNMNMEFLSSGFNFISTVIPGDYIYTKCVDAECKVLGPDCIILKVVKPNKVK